MLTARSAACSCRGSPRPATTCERADLTRPVLGPGRSRRARGLLAGGSHRCRRGVRPRGGVRGRRPHRGDPAADPQRAACRVRHQHDEHVQPPRGVDRGRAHVGSSTSRARRCRASCSRIARSRREYLPIDEQHPVRPQDAYATSKWFGELLCERAVERSDIRCTSIRPSWVQDEASYERNLGPIVRDPAVLIGNYCSYIDVHDLCDAVVLAIETDLPGSRGVLRRLARHDRRSPARRDREDPPPRRRHRDPADPTRGRIRGLDGEGRTAPRVEADSHRGATTSTTKGRSRS